MSHHTVLIVDDEVNILSTLKRVLADGDYTIVTAESAEEGLVRLKEYSVDMIISDLKMPGMNGLEFIESTIDEHPGIIRILLTGHADLQDALRAINTGCIYKFILKPWNNEDLKITVRRALEQRDLIMKNEQLIMDLKVRENMLNDLEKKYPGITQRPKNGIYEIKSGDND